MKTSSLLLALALSLTPHPSLLAQQNNIADDRASNPEYNNGWSSGQNGGYGFGEWKLIAQPSDDASRTYSGHFIAQDVDHSDLNGVATDGRAFGLYANGHRFEKAVAFRPLKEPLKIGDTFSIKLEHGDFVKKFDIDSPDPGSVGFTIRTGNAQNTENDYKTGARFELSYHKDKNNYTLIDKDGEFDTGVNYTDSGISVSFTLTGPDTYDLEIICLSDRSIKTFTGRHLAGEAGAPIESFALFAYNTEKSNAYFNNIQIARHETPSTTDKDNKDNKDKKEQPAEP
ncbi:MAG: hypothetical protein RML49_02625 [Verrucomicrobiae bacterium]|nr:hypothetical protein [Verrucomicrobiae bacterium]